MKVADTRQAIITRDEIGILAAALSAGLSTEANGIIQKLYQSTDDYDGFIHGMASDEWHKDGEIELDEGGVISVSADGGAYVMAWVWVGFETCPDCGAIEGSPEWGTVGDGFDGYCPSCADKREAEIG